MAKMPQCHLACLRRPNSAAKRAALRMGTGVRMFFFWERAGMSGWPGGGDRGGRAAAEECRAVRWMGARGTGESGAAGERGRAMEGLSMPDDGRGLWRGPDSRHRGRGRESEIGGTLAGAGSRCCGMITSGGVSDGVRR